LEFACGYAVDADADADADASADGVADTVDLAVKAAPVEPSSACSWLTPAKLCKSIMPFSSAAIPDPS